MMHLDYMMSLFSVDKLHESLPTFVNNHKLLTLASLAAGGVALGTAWYCYRPRNMPPGPWGFPIVGCRLDLEENEFEKLDELEKKYGDVFTLWHGGNRYSVVLNSYEAAKEAFIIRGCIFNNRNISQYSEDFGMEDEIMTSNYTERYVAARKFVLNAFRNSGMYDGRWDAVFAREFDELSFELSGTNQQPFDPQLLLRKCTTNVICSLMLGERYPYQSQDAEYLIKMMEDSFALMFLVFEANKHIFPPPAYIRWRYKRLWKEKLAEMINFIEKKIDRHIATFDPNHLRDVVDHYIAHGQVEAVGKCRLANTLINFFPDAIHTASSLLLWILVYLIKFPAHQERICREIQELMGSSGVHVPITEKAKFRFTRAFINEVIRIVSPIFVNMMARPMEQTTFRGYNIPVFADIRVNYYSIHRNPRTFPDPDEFKPERFMEADGGNIEGFLPFGIGRRSCLGEQIGKNELFFLTVNLVRRFVLEAAEGETLPSFDELSCRRTRLPTPFKIVIKERE